MRYDSGGASVVSQDGSLLVDFVMDPLRLYNYPSCSCSHSSSIGPSSHARAAWKEQPLTHTKPQFADEGGFQIHLPFPSTTVGFMRGQVRQRQENLPDPRIGVMITTQRSCGGDVLHCLSFGIPQLGVQGRN